MDKSFLVATTLGEGLMGLALLALPLVPLKLLFGVEELAPATEVVSRLLGVALLAIGITCWGAIRLSRCGSNQGLLYGLLTYDVGAAAILVYAGLSLGMHGLLLWPGVAVHGVLGGWCMACIFLSRRVVK